MISKYFRIEELVDKKTYEIRGEKAWELFSSDFITMIDTFKEMFPKGTITINNWLWGGNRQWSGLRTPDSPYYSPYSMHPLANGADMVFSAYSSEEVRATVKAKPVIFSMVRGLEDDVSWVHADTRNRDDLLIFKV